MAFWIIALGLAVVVGITLAVPLIQGRDIGEPPEAFDLRVYRDQLKEIDRDLERGVLGQEDAERVRAEVSRRILATDTKLQTRAPGGKASRGTTMITTAVLGLGILGGSAYIYAQLGTSNLPDLPHATRVAQAEAARANRPSQAAAEEQAPKLEANDAVTPEFMALVDQLRGVVATRPDDAQGHRLLAENEARLGNFKAAYAAQQRVIDIKGDTVVARDFADLADMMFWAAGGYVSPQAEEALLRALSLDPREGTARYYFALMMAQTGRPDRAYSIWRQQLAEGPPDAPWIALIQAQIPEIALRAGVDYTPIEVGNAGRGPDRAAMEAARDMSPAERREMIEGMVGGLSERLATEGGQPREWAQLINALGVLGRRDDAARILAEAQQAFAGDPEALEMLSNAADRAGIPQ